VSHYKYLGSLVNPDNTIEQEIKERIATGNKAFTAHLTLFKSLHTVGSGANRRAT
jgi:hypothetical protein